MYPQIVSACLRSYIHSCGRVTSTLSGSGTQMSRTCHYEKYGAVFIIGIGCKLSDGEKHDGRPGYDDILQKGWMVFRAWQMVTFIMDTGCSAALSYHPWVSVPDKEALQRQLKQGKTTGTLFISIDEWHCPFYRWWYRAITSLYVLFKKKLISAKFKPVSGWKICVRNVRNTIFTWFNTQIQIEKADFMISAFSVICSKK